MLKPEQHPPPYPRHVIQCAIVYSDFHIIIIFVCCHLFETISTKNNESDNNEMLMCCDSRSHKARPNVLSCTYKLFFFSLGSVSTRCRVRWMHICRWTIHCSSVRERLTRACKRAFPHCSVAGFSCNNNYECRAQPSDRRYESLIIVHNAQCTQTVSFKA